MLYQGSTLTTAILKLLATGARMSECENDSAHAVLNNEGVRILRLHDIVEVSFFILE
jgi:hypothetical protein